MGDKKEKEKKQLVSEDEAGDEVRSGEGVEVVDSTDEDGRGFQIIHCPEPADQLFPAQESTIPGHLVLVHIKTRIGFAIPFDAAHQLSHLIHEALEQLTGGDIDELETSKSDPTYH
jgi:hypothetical protein